MRNLGIFIGSSHHTLVQAVQMPITSRSQFVLRLALMTIAMLAIFIVDTVTNLEIAIAVFYAIVILTASRALTRRALMTLGGVCGGMTVLSFLLTQHGAYHAGLINMGISLAAIAMTTGLVLNMQAAKAAAHEAQAQLLRIARIRRLEGLTTSIAHEVNQPLAAIATSGGACQRWLAQQPPNLDKARQALERIRCDADRASSIIARVRSLTKGGPPHKSAFAFNQAITDIIALSQVDIQRHGIHLETRFQPDLPDAWADRIQIQQVMANLLLNAIEAMSQAAMEPRRLLVASTRQDDMIVGAVTDSGAGIPVQMQAHLFDAFWTTKEQGMGVGLSISRAIIEANGGQIWAQSAQPRGTTFQFSVPVAKKD